MNYDYSKLQNGSDIRGVALDTVPGEKVNLDAETVERLARGFLFLLTLKTDKRPDQLTISIGRDSRLSGPELEKAFADALKPYGTKIYVAGLASTPAMFMSTVFPEYDCDGAVMITASHLPSNRNGLKFFDKNGGFEKNDITDIINFAEITYILNQLPLSTPSEPVEIPLMDTYSAHLRQLIIDGVGAGERPLEGMKITVDAGNGAGGFYAGKVLEPLGADVSSSQFLEPDGSFPNHIPNPENKEAIESICAKVKEAGSDLGLIFDTDVDRVSAVDEKGDEINRNGIVAMAAALIADDYPGTTVVTDSITSTFLTDFLEKDLGLKHLRFKRGYRNVINKAIELCDEGIDSQLAIETSGHAAYKENYFLDDGAYLATKIVIRAAQLFRKGEKIYTVIAGLKEPAEAVEIRLPLKSDDFAAAGDRIIDKVREDFGSKGADYTVVLPNYEGVRISFNDPEIEGWMLLRKSLHDPIMPLNIEANVSEGVEKIREILRKELAGYEELDISKL